MTINLKALKQYSSAALNTSINSASPHELITMLFDGALESLAKTKGHMQRKEIQAKSDQLNRASRIILGLKDFLEPEHFPELAENLDALYEYMLTTLMAAHRDNNVDQVQEVMDLLLTIKSGWIQIKE